jgi:L-alanine-DL-glutamate epimerase-like enolase superfamily enzyme
VFDALGKALGVCCFARAEAVVEQAEGFRAAHGIRASKVKVGMDLERDIATVRALRDARGPSAVIYPDANHGFSPADALRFLDATQDCRLAWIDEPCPAEDVLAKQRIAAQSPIPILADESCPDVRSVVTEVLDGRSTMISIKLARTGIGISQRIRDFGEATGTGVLIGSRGDSSIRYADQCRRHWPWRRRVTGSCTIPHRRSSSLRLQNWRASTT